MSDFLIGRRQLYILPTRIGWYYALILIALFAIAVKFDNQPAFMMLFLLCSIGMVVMLHTHNNVIGLSLSSRSASSVFVGEKAVFPIELRNESQTERRALWLVCSGYQTLFTLAPQGKKEISLALPTVQRGYFNCADIILTSRFPIGIFFCWTKRFQPQERCLVYPQPLDLIPFPINDQVSIKSSPNHPPSLQSVSNTDDYSGMKAYQPGDRLRDVHWPSYAKTGKLVTIEHQEQSGDSVLISWFNLPGSMVLEDRLSQLCHWIMVAHQAGLRYQLELPNHTELYNMGDTHFHKCLTTLALWTPHEAAE